MKKLLFVCGQNRLRSPTAEVVFNSREKIEAASAGLNNSADNPLTPELIDWADIIFVMEKIHKNRLSKKFNPYLKNKKIICLDIADNYEYMDQDLIDILEKKVARLLGSY